MNNPSPSKGPDLVQQLSDLFMETGQAHHQAFIEGYYAGFFVKRHL